MGRRKVQIKRIEDDRARKVTFAKRKHGLVKKAMELSLLCDCDIALLIFTREKPDPRFYKYTSSGINSILEKLSKNPPVVEDRHNGQYEALYVKKGKDAIDPEADMEVGGGFGAPAYAPAPGAQGRHQKNLSVEIPGGDLSGASMMQLGGELNTPNSTALFNQLGSSLLPQQSMLSPGGFSLGSLGSGGIGGVPQAFSPNTLAAFGGSTGLTPNTRSSAKQADLSAIKEDGA